LIERSQNSARILTGIKRWHQREQQKQFHCLALSIVESLLPSHQSLCDLGAVRLISGLAQYAAHPSMSRRALFEHIAAL